MLHIQQILLPIEILLETVLNQYLSNSYCLTIISDNSMNCNFPVSFTYIVPNVTQNMVDQLLELSEMGCSDYIVRLKRPQTFINSFKKVNQIGNVRRSDKKIIFLPHEDETGFDLMRLLTMREISLVANILLIIESSKYNLDCKFYDLISHKYIGPDNESDQPLYIDQWNSCSKTFDKNASLFPHDISNLHGKTLRVACFTYKPYVLLDLDTNVTPLGRDGTQTRLAEEFCRWVNCTIELVREDEHQWGEVYENETYGVGVFADLLYDRADLGMPLGAWYEQYKVLDFSTFNVRAAAICVAPSPRLISSWQMPILPFNLYMWLAVFITFVLASVALSFAKGSSDGAILTTFGMMITQSQSEEAVGSTWRMRSITGWLMISGLILDNAYGGSLPSIFAVPRHEPYIDTVEDLVNSGLEWGATHDVWIFSLKLSSQPLIKQLVSMFRAIPANELRQKTFTRTMAFPLERLHSGYFAFGDYISEEVLTDFSVMTEELYFEYGLVMLRKSSAYTEKLSQLVGRLHQSGLLLAWETQIVLKHMNYSIQHKVQLSRSKSDIDNVVPLGFQHVVGVFIIYAIGVSMSTIAFVFEILNNKRHKSGQSVILLSRYNT